MWEVMFRGHGSVASRWEGVFGTVAFLVPDSDPEREVSERKRGRSDPSVTEDAAFFVIDTVDIVVCASPDRVISTWEAFPKRMVYRLLRLFEGVYAARGSMSDVKPDGVPPSVAGRGFGRSTVREPLMKTELTAEDPIKADSPENILLVVGERARSDGRCCSCCEDNERARLRDASDTGSVCTRRGEFGGAVSSPTPPSSSSQTALIRRLPIVLREFAVDDCEAVRR